ncbi:hypothetical protein DCAR_0417673 [Daucus carota subsp. sativus]|uniref:Uncharacterized protein n=1 Tax=Daucus carota subsp. sativus TaxID=79200 RepID=A0AAF0WYD6_DAUCS|nr:PREDICTED: UPF0481 protein At3g47200 [Daucus carota subsp. sativus]WOG98332.1 hypothetical protein DCAR_0417673 [Daucus carota subsp. sativus]
MIRNKHAVSSENHHHTIKIWEVNEARLASMQQKIVETKPTLLSKSAGSSTCSIFRVPQSFIDINGRCYQPHIVSIGPYHHGEPHLKMIEEHKWRFLGTLLHRTERKGLSLEDYLKAIQPLESEARECYSEVVKFGTDEFIEMMVLDGCFIIELFRKLGDLYPFEPDDPLISMSWVYSFFLRDLLRLENQIPFFILQRLFDLSTLPEEESGKSLAELALNFFNSALQRPDEVLDQHKNLVGKHLLDFVRASLIPPGDPDHMHYNNPSHVIHCVSKLRRAGIKLKPGKSTSFLVIKFSHGVLEMPSISMDDFMSSFLINCVAYEQCHKSCSKHMTTYTTMLDCLINTSKDVEYLWDHDIVENFYGTDSELARLINNMGKDVTLDIDRCYLAKVFNDVNQYYRNNWHVTWASFQYTYFATPWSFISAFAALVLLILTIIQTFYTVLSFVDGMSKP